MRLSRRPHRRPPLPVLAIAAEQRAEKKMAKYGRLAAAVSSQFRPAVAERFGACCDALVGLVSMLCGDRRSKVFYGIQLYPEDLLCFGVPTI